MTTFAWPDVLQPRDFGFYFLDADTSGGVALGGGEQVVFSPGPRWGAAMTVDIRNNDQVRAARGLRTNLRGRANPVALPNFDGQRLSWPIQVFGGKSTGVVLHPGVTRDKTLDGTAYEQPAIPTESEIVATLYADAALRATTADIHVTQGAAPKRGQQFGIGARLYEIGSVGPVAGPTPPPLVYTVTFWPPLRAAADEDDVVKFTRPTCLMRCMNLNEELRKLEMLRFATLNLEFVEYL